MTSQSLLLRTALALFFAAVQPAFGQVAGSGEVNDSRQNLIRAYPEMLERVDGDDLLFRDGTRLPFGGRQKDRPFEAWLAAPTLDDIFALPYPTGDLVPPAKNQDPGRARPAQLFDKMYGDCRKGEVEQHLTTIRWLPRKANQPLRVTRINGVDRKLAAISTELDALPKRFDVYLHPAAGTYACRVIAGTDRPSAHGHGIAIDVALKHAHYWRWSKASPDGTLEWRNAIPIEIVRIFEKHGFIWGGRWYHYDTMHFEYRPELLP